MTELFIRVHLILSRHRSIVLLLAGLFAVGALLLGRRLKLNEDFTDMLPMSDPAIAEQAEALKRVHQADRLYVDVGTTILEPDRLTQAADEMFDALRQIPGLGDFRYNLEGAAAPGEVYEQLQSELPTLLTSNELRELEARLQPDALEKRLAWLKKALSQPRGLMLAHVAQSDPAGLSDAVLARLRALQAGVGDARIVRGRITSADGCHVLISAAPAFRSSEIRKSAPLMEAVLKAARSVEARFPRHTVRIAITGAHRSALDNATMIRQDTTRTSVIASAAVLALMMAAYRRRRLALLGLLPTVFGALGAMVIFYLVGDPVSAVALGCGSILIGVTVDYGIYVLYHTDDLSPRNREQLAHAVAQLIPALTFGALTTMAAFLVMFLSPVPGHRQLGLFGAVGVGLAAVFAIVVLPSFIPIEVRGERGEVRTEDIRPDPALKNRKSELDSEPPSVGCQEVDRSSRPFTNTFIRRSRGDEAHSFFGNEPAFRAFLRRLLLSKRAGSAAGGSLPLTIVMQRLFDWRSRRARMVLVLLLLFTGVCAAGVWRLHFDGDLARLNGVTAETRRDEEIVRGIWGQALSLTTVVVSGTNREEALQKNEAVCALLRTLRKNRNIESFSSIAPLIPSDRTRRANRCDWRAFWTEGRCRDLSNSLASAAANLGFRAGAFQPFLAGLASPANPSIAATGMDSAWGRLAAEYWSEEDGRIFVTTLVKVENRESYRQLREAIRKAVAGAMLLNKTALADEITRIARRALPVFAVLVAALNALLLYLLLGRLELVSITLLPMAAGVFWTLGVLGLLGLPIDMSNFIFVIFVIGVGGDYSLFMVLAELEPLCGYRERTASTGGAVTICALTTLLGVGVLVLARHPALFSIGLTALLGISLSLLATLFLVPPCMSWVATRCRASGPGRIPGEPAAKHGCATLLLERAAEACSHSWKRKQISRLYRYQGPYVTQFVYWKMKTDPLFDAVEKAVPAGGEILDLGCGYGLVAHWLTILTPERRVRGVDFDANKIRVAQVTARANSRVNFEQRDILEWPEFPACDCALLCDVLHYFPHELKAEVLRKVFQALRPGGCLIIRDAMANENSSHRAVARAEKWAVRLGQNKTRHGLHFEDENAHLALLREAGCAKVEVRDGPGLGSNLLLIARKAGDAIT